MAGPKSQARPVRASKRLKAVEALFDGRAIVVRGAREHNLKNVDLTIPRDKLVVFTGLSGSGKSSLAFDTIYAEGQRRYVESLSAYARQFLEMMQKPDVDQIDGLSPAIAIEQKTTSKNPRSTVGTVTEIHDYMRLLWARVGIPYSPATGLPIESQTVSQMVDRVLALPDRTRLYLLAPVVRGRKGEYRKEIADYMKRGFQRLKIDGQFYEIADAPALDKKFKHDIEVVVDRIVVRPDMAARLAESFETALDLADGLAFAEFADTAEGESEPRRILFSSKFACPVSGFTIPEIEPRLFSFNNPFGACPVCGGLGSELRVDDTLVVPNPKLTLRQGAIAPWAKSNSPYYLQTLEALARRYKFRLDKPWSTLPEEARRVILHGSGADEIRFAYDDGLRAYEVNKPFEGVVANLERRYKETESEWSREEIQRYMTATPCEACHGFRLKPEALAVKIDGRHIGEVSLLSVSAAIEWAKGLPAEARRQAQRDRATNPQGDHRSAHLPARRRPRLSHACAFIRHAVGRREPAHPARFADRLGPHRRALCARRAVDRPPPTRQRSPPRYAQAPARPRQHGDCGRARRGCNLDRRLCRRHRSGRGRAWGRNRRRRNAGRDRRQSQFADRPLSLGRADGRYPGQAPRSPIRPASSRSSARVATT